MAENRRGKRFYFSRGQLFLLGVGFTAAAVVIFLLGMMVGKGIEEGKMSKVAEPVTKIPVNPSAQESKAASGTSSKEEMTFYDTLTKTPVAQSPSEKKLQETKRAVSACICQSERPECSRREIQYQADWRRR